MAQGTSKVKTEDDHRDDPPRRRVLWIDWDSGLRGSGLTVGDRIVGDRPVDRQGGLYTAEDLAKGTVLGGHAESRRWERLGLTAGDALTVQVERAGGVAELSGSLTENRSTRDAEGRRSFGEDGPAHSEKDGFTYAWYSWYGPFRDLAQTVLLGWDYTVGYDTRRLAAKVEEHRERVDFLEKTYPGAFARAVRHDFDAMVGMLAGEPRELSEADLEYRQLGEVRAAQVTEAADRAHEAFLAELQDGERGDDVLEEPFPVPDPFEEDIAHLVGKTVRLPEIGDRDILFEAKRSWFTFGRSQGVYVIDRHAETTKPFYTASGEYIEKVNPFLTKRRIAFFGVIEPAPALISDVIKNVTVVALRVRPIAALVTNAKDPEHRFFVDMRPDSKHEGAFAGEDRLLAVGRPKLEPEMGPGEVLEVYFDCLKMGDFDTWLACFATWKVRQWYGKGSSHLYVDLTWKTVGEREAVSLWDNSRRELLGDVYAVEVAEVGAPRIVYDAARQPAAAAGGEPEPRTVEEVRLLVNHVGRFGEDADGKALYRTFAGGKYHRKWTLQRLDDGPWRVTNAQPI